MASEQSARLSPTHPSAAASGQSDDSLPTASTSTTTETGKRKLKHKRTQNSACDACRHRRVRCIRADDNEECTPCMAKGVRCTHDYVANKPKINRSGKLIRAAQSMYGVREGNDEEGKEEPVTPLLSPAIAQEPDLQTAHTLLAINPVEQSLVTRTVSSTLAIRLLSFYFSYIHFQLPILDWEGFYGRFEAANHQPDQMGEYGEVLCLAAISFGARVADLPELLGPGAPTLSELRERANDSIDLAIWGERRKPFCRALLQRTLSLVDSRGVMRHPTMDCICALLLLQYLVDHGGEPEHANLGRMLSAGALEQMRVLNDSPNGTSAAAIGQIRGGRLFWCSFIRDAMAAAHSGRALQITQLDIQLFCPLILDHDRSAIMAELSSDDASRVARSAAFNLFGELALLARSISERVTGPGAQAHRAHVALDLDWVSRTFWSTVDNNTSLCEYFASRIESVFGPRASTFHLWLRTLCFCRLALVALMHGVLTDEAGRIEVTEAGNPKALSRIRGMLVESQRRLFLALRAMVEIVKASALTGVAFGGGLLLSGLPHFTELMTSLPAAEDGGPAEWPLHDKVDSIEWMLLAMKRMSWAWGENPSTPRVEASLVPLRERLSLMQSAAVSSLPLPTPHYDYAPFYGAGAPMPILPPSYASDPSAHAYIAYSTGPGQGSLFGLTLDNLLDPNVAYAGVM